MSFVLPAFRSSFSLLYGTTSPEAILTAVGEYGYKNALLVDRNNLYGCYDFYYGALQKGIKPIIGSELTTDIGDLFLLCKSHNGFKNLCRLITEYQLREKPTIASLAKHSQDIICVTKPTEHLGILRDIYFNDMYCEIGYGKPAAAYRFAAQSKIKSVALPVAAFLRKDNYSAHRLLRAIDGGHLLDNLPESETAGREAYLRESGWYDRYFAAFPESLRNSEELVEKCHLSFPAKKNILPDVAIDGDHFAKLSESALSGLSRKLSSLSGRYLSRLEYELSVIRRTGFVDYFLIVGEIVDYCHQQRIPAVGRGSAAGSLVAFGLDITQVDPIRENLYFERFLNEARSDCPDVDIDIDWRRRDDVLDFIYKKYGDDHVAMMATYVRFQPRLAIRESAKTLGFTPEEIDEFIKRIPREPLEQWEAESVQLPSASGRKFDWKRLKPALELARMISNLPRHLGIHSGGIVITPDPLTNYVPLERATKGLVVTQCDMYQAEKIGLVKIDILGQRGLAVIADCYTALEKISGQSFQMPDNDQVTYEMLRAGKTIGVFQIESPGLRALLRDIKPQELNDITLALSLIRPGASESGMKKIFLDRFHGRENIKYPHQSLSSILRETYGVFIYQEQVILAAQKIAGFNLPASDLLRRAITKKRHYKDNEKLNRRFLDGALGNNVDAATAQNIYNQLAQFASFGFCKAHAATYGYLAYQSAYFKAHYPDMFMAAVLRNGGGYYPSAVYVAEARRLGITVMPPDANISENSDSLHDGRIYLGIGRVKEISQATLDQIAAARPFSSLDDFLSRVEIREREMENLIKIGFFDSMEISRPKLLWQYRLWGKNIALDRDNFFNGAIASPRIKNMPLSPTSRFEVFRAENSILELAASFHPLTLFEGYLSPQPDSLFGQKNNSAVFVSGWLADRKKIKTRNGKSMVFLTFDSLVDTFEVVIFPDMYDRYAETIRAYRYLTVEGKINLDDGNPAIIAIRIYPAETGLREIKYI